MLTYPNINPVAIALGPVKVHWYGIMYLVAFVAAWWLGRRRAAQVGSTWSMLDVDDLIFYCAVGVIFGGRIGWLLVYGHASVAENVWNVFRIWQGGMSFHGGMAGAMIAAALFARKRARKIFDVLDFLAPLPGIGLMAGRLGNFINGELWGKPTDAPWAMLVRDPITQQMIARHPSQLYEALLEGLVLFLILWWFTAKPRPRFAPSALFLLLYGAARVTVEFVRLPDADIGYLAGGWLTMGMVLTAPMFLAGIVLMIYAYRRGEPSGNYLSAASPS
jgi:phosphatidylglycerol---prolipoprotein diacylglyceryl transferase